MTAIKIFKIHFSNNNKHNMERKFLTAISNIQSVYKIWLMRDLTLVGKIIVSKKLTLSKMVPLCFTLVVPKQIIEEIENIQKNFLWNWLTPKIKHSTPCNYFTTSDLTNVNINTKIASLRCSWIKRLYDNRFHDWKLIPLHWNNTFITPEFKLHQSLALIFQLEEFPQFFRNIF